jgi:hypothetical protein
MSRYLAAYYHYLCSVFIRHKKTGLPPFQSRSPVLRLSDQIELFEQLRFIYQVNVCTLEAGPGVRSLVVD